MFRNKTFKKKKKKKYQVFEYVTSSAQNKVYNSSLVLVSVTVRHDYLSWAPRIGCPPSV